MRNLDSLATISLVSRLCDKNDKKIQPLKPKEYWELCDKLSEGPKELFEQSAEELSKNYYWKKSDHKLPDKIALLLNDNDHAKAIDSEIKKLHGKGIKTLTPFDDCYPKRLREQLKDKSPPLLYVAGDLDLLQRPGVGIVGSRDINKDGAERAEEAAERAAQLDGYVLISGGARGVDQIAMDSALEAGGSVVGILADSFLRRLRRPDVRRAIHDGRAAMCTPYNPDAPFNVGMRMGRNKLVYALSLITLVIASEHDKGGTWAGAVEALNNEYGRVVVWRGKGEGVGNQELIAKGAEAISSIDDLETVLQQMATSSDDDTEAEPFSERSDPVGQQMATLSDDDAEVISSTEDAESALKDPPTTSPEPKAESVEPTPAAQPSLF